MSKINAQDEQQYEMVMAISEFLKNEKLVANDCDGVAMRLYECLQKVFGGCNIYFKKGVVGQADEEGRQMLIDQDKGLSIHQIAQKYQKTCQSVYKKLSKARAERRKQNNENFGAL